MGKEIEPRIWVLLGEKAGDNTQLTALANHLERTRGWPWQPCHLRFRRSELISHLLAPPNLLGVAEGREALAPPWPDLVLSAGRRSEPVAHWIARHSDHPVRLVHIGRPWAQPRRWDLVVATPQYQVPPAGNVLVQPLPLLPAPEAERSDIALPDLPRPWLAVLVGGDSGAFRFDVSAARRLGEAAVSAARSTGASLLVTTSRRTPRRSADALRQTLDLPHHFFDWHRDSTASNPYRAYLAEADAFMVTGESASMLAEAVATGRPVSIFPLPRTIRGAWRWKPLTYYLGEYVGPRRMRRDIGRLHAHLIEQGMAGWAGEAPPRKGRYDAHAALEQVARRVERLFGTTAAQT